MKLCKEGPVHIVKHDKPAYVVLTEDYYRELVDGYEEASFARIEASIEDIKAGRVTLMTAQQLIDEFGLRD